MRGDDHGQISSAQAGTAPRAPSVAFEAPRFGVFVPAVLAFAGSGCLLVLEIVAERLLAPALGITLYTCDGSDWSQRPDRCDRCDG